MTIRAIASALILVSLWLLIASLVAMPDDAYTLTTDFLGFLAGAVATLCACLWILNSKAGAANPKWWLAAALVIGLAATVATLGLVPTRALGEYPVWAPATVGIVGCAMGFALLRFTTRSEAATGEVASRDAP